MDAIGRTTAAIVAVVAGALAPPHAARAASFETLYRFTGGADGATPYRGPLLAAGGVMYGTAFTGANACPDSYANPGVGCGTLWKLSGSTLTPVVTFLGASNGASPDTNLTASGNTLYSATYTGGANNQGTLFRVATSGLNFKLLHSFTGTDGAHPNGALRADAHNNLFSAAPFGGTGYTGTDLTGYGVIYEWTASQTYKVVHNFAGTDGAQPGRIFISSAGIIYGGTSAGGACSGTGLPANGCGTVFAFNPATSVLTTLYTFTGTTDGYQPGLAGIDSAGNLLGYTVSGGKNSVGTLFALRPNGSGGYGYVKLWDFTGGLDGATPYAPPALVTGSDTMVGTTLYGGSGNTGTLWLYQKGKVTGLHSFLADADGGYPESTPVLDSAGNVYGLAAFGGVMPCTTSGGTLISTYGCGTVWKYTR